MSRFAAIFVFCLTFAQLRATSPVLTLQNELIPSPAPVGAHNPEFFSDANRVVLSWRTNAAQLDVQQSFFDPAHRLWKKAVNHGIAVGRRDGHGRIESRNAGRTARAWFNPEPKDPSIQITVQPQLHDHFTMPLRIEDGHPSGDPDLILLADGTVFVSWPEHYNQNETALWLRRISPGGALSVPVLLAVFPAGQPGQRLALVKDFDDKPAQLLLAYTVGQGDTSQILTRLLTIDFATTANRHTPCSSCPDPEASGRGYALRGRVVSISLSGKALVAKHGGIGEVLPAGETEFKVDSATFRDATPGGEFFARIEKRSGDWWLFNASWVVRGQP